MPANKMPEMPAPDGWMNLHGDQSVQQVRGVTMQKLETYGRACYLAGIEAARGCVPEPFTTDSPAAAGYNTAIGDMRTNLDALGRE